MVLKEQEIKRYLKYIDLIKIKDDKKVKISPNFNEKVNDFKIGIQFMQKIINYTK